MCGSCVALTHTTRHAHTWTASQCNYCYPGNLNAANPNTIKVSYGGNPVSQQPWAGALINGKGRAIPLNYSSDYMSATSQSWGQPAGSYFTVNVQKGAFGR